MNDVIGEERESAGVCSRTFPLGLQLQTSSITDMSTFTLIQECCLTLTSPLFSFMTGSGQERKRLIDPSQAVI